MRANAYVLGFIGALGLTAVVQTAVAMPLVPGSTTVAAPSMTLPVKHKCAKGQRWEPAGYAEHGKYRAAHCAPA